MKLWIINFLLVFAISCNNHKAVTITKDYVINPNWDKVDNSLAVYRMKLKDSSKRINLKDPTEPELYYGLIEDSTFSFHTNIKYNGEDYAKRKVYFNRNNGLSWGRLNDRHSNYEQDVIGVLEKNTWYLLAGLSKLRTLYYVYIDNADSVHVYKVSTMTNY